MLRPDPRFRTGYCRGVLFGAGIVTDAFFVAFRIPNLLRRLLAEGSLTVSFVPVFTQYLKQKSRTEALELANVAFTALSVLLVIVCLAGVVFAPAIVMVMAPGFQSGTSQYDLTVMLTRFMFPIISSCPSLLCAWVF